MPEIKGVSPEEAIELMKDGWIYVDVRSVPEFEAGHVPESLNIPLLNMGPGGMQPNTEFMKVMQGCFKKSDKLLLGCRSGGRSRRAAEMLIAIGYTDLADLVTGWEGTRDHFGRIVPGWSKKDLPVETGSPPGRGYTDLKARCG
ncbi:MAG: rhodanese-like domain-containing protein [Polyangiaceae bacterium]